MSSLITIPPQTILVTEFLFGLALFVNALLFIPQAWRIFRQKQSQEVSLVTFIGFWLIQLFTVFHAMIKHDSLLLWGYICSLITCGGVIVLALYYRRK
ncbi:MAG: hypothetical protein A3F41_06450 [Coxiella sp. RIFCSPHIGHO2_12_FULL_44_14]|nr:MAG: hypothetical protein A3F41_06450 [Coxiella sp. RIFCSPHIGHO2_12_FULL_44_14]